MGALYIDTPNRLIGDLKIYRGTVPRIAVEPRKIFLHALLRGAAKVVAWHTPPSEDSSPSLESLAFTRRMSEATSALGVPLAGHLIFGSTGRCVSLRERGTL